MNTRFAGVASSLTRPGMLRNPSTMLRMLRDPSTMLRTGRSAPSAGQARSLPRARRMRPIRREPLCYATIIAIIPFPLVSGNRGAKRSRCAKERARSIPIEREHDLPRRADRGPDRPQASGRWRGLARGKVPDGPAIGPFTPCAHVNAQPVAARRRARRSTPGRAALSRPDRPAPVICRKTLFGGTLSPI